MFRTATSDGVHYDFEKKALVRQKPTQAESTSIIRASASVARSNGTYQAAQTGGRRLATWVTTDQTLNSILAAHGAELTRKSREIVRRNSWASNGLETWQANCVGTGIKPQPKHPDEATCIQLQNDFKRWTDEADADGLTDFYGLEALIAREVMEAGEIFVRFRPRRLTDGLYIPLQLQLLEPEFLPHEKNQNLENGSFIRNGIEFGGPFRRRQAYHFYRDQPGDVYNVASTSMLNLLRVPVDEVAHIYKPVRGGQHRGVPWFAQILVRLHEFDKYEDAELARKMFSAMITHIITEINEEDPVTGRNSGEDGDEDCDSTPIEDIQPGSTIKLKPGEKMDVSQPADSGATYAEFLRMQLYAIAAGMGITYEMLTGDLKGVSFSSIRQGVLEFRRRCEQFQHQVLVYKLCRPLWKKWIEACVLAGRISARAYRKDPYAYLDVDWQPPKWPWVDPEKDIAAAALEVRNGFRSQSNVINATGEDPNQVRAEIAADNAANDAKGLRFDCDGRYPVKALSTDTAAPAAEKKPPKETP